MNQSPIFWLFFKTVNLCTHQHMINAFGFEGAPKRPCLVYLIGTSPKNTKTPNGARLKFIIVKIVWFLFDNFLSFAEPDQIRIDNWASIQNFRIMWWGTHGWPAVICPLCLFCSPYLASNDCSLCADRAGTLVVAELDFKQLIGARRVALALHLLLVRSAESGRAGTLRFGVLFFVCFVATYRNSLLGRISDLIQFFEIL
jgi:hypothetical protein